MAQVRAKPVMREMMTQMEMRAALAPTDSADSLPALAPPRPAASASAASGDDHLLLADGRLGRGAGDGAVEARMGADDGDEPRGARVGRRTQKRLVHAAMATAGGNARLGVRPRVVAGRSIPIRRVGRIRAYMTGSLELVGHGRTLR